MMKKFERSQIIYVLRVNQSFEAEIVVAKPDTPQNNEYDALYDKAVEFVCEKGYASTSAVQRQFRIGTTVRLV